MANEDQLRILKQGVNIWNKWREKHPGEYIDLSGENLKGNTLIRANFNEANLHRANLAEANLKGAILSKANLAEAFLSGANLSEANLEEADLSSVDISKATLFKADLARANLRGANFYNADLFSANLDNADLRGADLQQVYLAGATLHKADIKGAKLNWANLCFANLINADLSGRLTSFYHADFQDADLRGADLHNAYLKGANFSDADLREANLRGATLHRANLVCTNLEKADLTGCSIFGISAWRLNLREARQSDLVITSEDESIITVDNLEIAQFIYLLLYNEKVRQAIDAITSKVVLILGRFKPERKVVLDAIRDELRKRNYLPVLFDFEKPTSRDLTETISTLAHMSRFIIADVTDAKSIPAELERIVPDLPSVPVQPLILDSDYEYALFEHIRKYQWVLDTYRYKDQGQLIASLGKRVIAPAEKKVEECRIR